MTEKQKQNRNAEEPDETGAQSAGKLVKGLTFDPGAFDAMVARTSSTASEGGEARTLRRRGVKVTVWPEMCRPGAYDQPIQITLLELDSDQELRALRKLGQYGPAPSEGNELPTAADATSSGQALSLVLGRASVHAVNGRVLAPHEKDYLWDSLSMPGRLAIGAAFLEHCAGLTGDALGNSLASVEIE